VTCSQGCAGNDIFMVNGMRSETSKDERFVKCYDILIIPGYTISTK